MNLSEFLRVTPDTIIKEGTASITFFFVPGTGKFFDDSHKTHEEMLYDDDVFDAVYPGLMDQIDESLRAKGLRGAKLDSALEKQLKPYRSRGVAAKTSVLGRFGILGSDPVIAFWRSVDDPQVKQATEALMKKYAQIKKMMGSVVVTGADAKTEVPEGKPILLSKLFSVNVKGIQKEIPELTKQMGLAKPVDYDLKKFNIGGQIYSLADISKLRGATHSKKNYDPSLPSDPFGVLCHPDMKRYPELSNYVPNCPGAATEFRPTHPEMWRQKGRELGDPYLYKYGEFVKYKDSIINEDDPFLYQEDLVCDLCGRPYEEPFYMVNDKVWKKSGVKDMAHIECLEKKLGRRLNYGDFTQYANTPVNDANDKVQERMNELPANWGNAVGGVEKRWDRPWD